jgi:hypothetical protein
MALSTRARIAGILAISLLMLGAPSAQAGVPVVDALIRPGWNPSYVGDEVFNDTGDDQSVINSGVIGQKLTFFIKFENPLESYNTYRVKRSGLFDPGYRVRYYDAANNDVTGQVNTGTFIPPQLPPHGTYEMRATVKIRSQATHCSTVTRLITVSFQQIPEIKDTVGFTAGLAPLCP